MRILVTGANGFVGRTLCSRLLALDHQVVPVVRQPSRFVGECLVYNESSWRAALHGCDCVVHLAGRAHIMHDKAQDPLTDFRSANVDFALEVAHRAVEAGVRRFIFISTIKVNGESTAPGHSFKPEDMPEPQDPYAVSKWEAEQALRVVGEEAGMEVVIIRPPLVYGPGVKGNFHSLMRWVARGVMLPLGGATKNRRSLVALDNLVDLIEVCAVHPNAADETFLVSDGEDLSTAELLRRTGKALQRPARLLFVPVSWLILAASLLGKQSVAQRLLGSLQVDISKTCNLLGWQPPLSVDEGLRKLVGSQE